MSIIAMGLMLVGGIVVVAVIHAFVETIAYAIDNAKEHSKRFDGK